VVVGTDSEGSVSLALAVVQTYDYLLCLNEARRVKLIPSARLVSAIARAMSLCMHREMYGSTSFSGAVCVVDEG
jgi:hypothetical protein